MKIRTLICFVFVFFGNRGFSQLSLTTSTTQNTICNGVGCNYSGPSILINEVMLCPTTHDGSIFGTGPGFGTNDNEGEWIELYNPDLCFPKDISGFLLGNNAPETAVNHGGGFIIPANTIVPSRGFCVIRGVNATPVPSNLLIQNGGNTIEIVVYSPSTCLGGGQRLWFPNSGGWFAFYDKNGNPQDAISWASNTNSCMTCNPCIPSTSTFAGTLLPYNTFPATMKTYISANAPTAGMSFRRFPDGGNWQVSTPSTPTIGGCNSTCISPAVVTCNGTALVNAQGGTPPYTYLWSGGSSPVNSLDTGLCGATYFVTVTDNTGLTATTSVTVPNWVPSSSFTILPDSFCINNTATATYNGDVADTATFTWTITGGTLATGIGIGPHTVSSTLVGNHTIGLSVLQNGCTSNIDKPFFIYEILSNTAIIHPPLCTNTATGEATANGLNGISPYSYHWSNGNQTQNATGLAANTSYYVTVTDGIGCTVSNSISLTDPTPISITTTKVNETCSGACNGSITALASGSTPPYMYQWQNNSSVISTASNYCAGSYNLTVTDAHNCTNSIITTVGTDNFISVSASANPQEAVAPADIQFLFTGSGASVYDWRFGDGVTSTISNPIHQYLMPGTYTVTLIASSGSPNFCADTTTLVIVIVPPSYVTIPNVYTPNGDGFNDAFYAVSSGLESETMKIYNRWGRVIFTSETVSEPWTGKNGSSSEMPDGVYYYIYHAVGFDKKVYDLHGSITLIR